MSSVCIILECRELADSEADLVSRRGSTAASQSVSGDDDDDDDDDC